jgi:hypothetical protein
MEDWIMPDINLSALNPIPYGNTASRPTAQTGQPYFNGEVGRLELYTPTGWQNIVQETPGVATISGNYSEATNSGTITINGTNFVPGAIASAIGTNGVEYQAQSTTYNSIVQLTAVFTGLSSAYEPYDIKVANPSNLFGLLPDALYVNNSPIWTTPSGSLGTFIEQVSISVSATATDPESQSITYSLAVGSSLPSGLTLNSSTGVISGTLPNISTNTTYSFTINASDGVNSIPRTFNITTTPLGVASGGTLTSDATYYYRTFTANGTFTVSDSSLPADIFMIAGGGGGGGQGGNDGSGGGGAGGAVYAQTTLAIGSYSITVGGGGSSVTGGNGSGGSGTNSTFTGLTNAIGGGGGASESSANRSGVNGGCGGGGGGYSGGGSVSIQTSGTTQTGIGYGTGGAAASGTNNGYANGGGGGIGQEGQVSGNGGNGLNTWSTWVPISNLAQSGYIGGGGGCSGDSRGNSNGRSGGAGGGGAGGNATNGSNGNSGVQYTGSGGGGVAGSNPAGSGRSSGAGGSGIVVIRYAKSVTG